MTAVLLRELRGSWRATTLWSLAIVGVLTLWLPLYDDLVAGDGRAALGALPPRLAQALGSDDLTSGPGYVQATFYGLWGFLLVTAASVSWAATAIAGHEQSGRLELDLAHGISRGGYVLAQSAALIVRVVLLVLVGTVTILAFNGPAGLGLDPGPILVASCALAGLALVCGLWTLLAGAATGRRALSAGVGALVAVGGYALHAVAVGSAGANGIADLSPYSWAFAGSPLQGGVTLASQWPLWLFVAALPVVAMLALRARDLRV